MKVWPILTMTIELESDVVAVRQRARRLAELLGFDVQAQTRVATSVSEIARNAQSYAEKGRAEFYLDGRRMPERFVVRITDRGPAIPNLEAVLAGDIKSEFGMGLGIIGARRLMGDFQIDSQPGLGTTVTMGKRLPRNTVLTPDRLAEIGKVLTRETAADPMMELRAQNQELMLSLSALEERRLEISRLADELERTNKGVVALYAELDLRTQELEHLNATLEQRVAEGMAAREQAEARLRQAQKMEAVGQLTGGIAHDFNNLLMIIGGSLELIRRRIPSQAGVDRLLDAAQQSVARGGALNQQLLAFARRQDLRAEVVDVTGLTDTLHDLIERAVSEDVRIEVEQARGLWLCHADAHQLETAVLNLAINARDAMPNGGTLTLGLSNHTVDAAYAETWSAVAGDYVVVCVADTGFGMAPEVLAHAFEPFFTTKEVGRGTGLGLSQIYGFATQLGGFVAIDSEVGKGTRVMIHLPRAEGASPTAAEDVRAPSRVEGFATILVVEDDVAVRTTAAALLHDLGYTVVEAGSGHEALDRLADQEIDLVFSDVILPDGMSGVDLADTVHGERPNMPVLLTSGYTAQRLNLSDQGERLRVLRKPYNGDQLSEAIRAALSA